MSSINPVKKSSFFNSSFSCFGCSTDQNRFDEQVSSVARVSSAAQVLSDEKVLRDTWLQRLKNEKTDEGVEPVLVTAVKTNCFLKFLDDLNKVDQKKLKASVRAVDESG